MRIVHLSAELAPIAKVGGLGDVVYGLAKEQVRKGEQVEVILPKHKRLHLSKLDAIKKFPTPLFVHEFPVTVWKATLESIPVTLIEIDHPNNPFERDSIYGFSDDPFRFIIFALAAQSYLSNQRLDILHLHDWHTSIAALLSIDTKGTVLTIHNMRYQGQCLPEELKIAGLERQREKLKDPHNPEMISLLKGGILFSDRVTTVSPTYAKEVLSPPESYGMERTLKQKGITGILNGIDYDYWNSAYDPYLSVRYRRDHWEELQESKRKNREEIQKKLNMSKPKGPLVSAISRLVPQKGPHLIKAALKETLRLGGQAILLGAGAPPDIDKEFRELAEEFKSNRDIHFHFDYDEALGHELYAASDLLLVPSLFEPCGLTQMIAMRYGTLPLVRLTGGLADTVVDGKNGFSFRQSDPGEIINALKRAFTLYQANPLEWKKMVEEGARSNFTWTHSAALYRALYSEILKSKNA